jgi:hypothetical protein
MARDQPFPPGSSRAPPLVRRWFSTLRPLACALALPAGSPAARPQADGSRLSPPQGPTIELLTPGPASYAASTALTTPRAPSAAFGASTSAGHALSLLPSADELMAPSAATCTPRRGASNARHHIQLPPSRCLERCDLIRLTLTATASLSASLLPLTAASLRRLPQPPLASDSTLVVHTSPWPQTTPPLHGHTTSSARVHP